MRELFRKWLAAVDQQDRPAERVQPLQILLTLDSVKSSAFGLVRKPARYQRCCKEAEQSNPILWIGDGEPTDWLHKEEVEGECRGN